MRPTAAQQQPPNAKNTPNVSNGPNVSNRPNVSNETQDESWVFLLDDENSATHGSPKDVLAAEQTARAMKDAMRRAAEVEGLRDAETRARLVAAQQEELRSHQEALGAGVARPVK
jgi:hypothetical protein